MSSELSDLSDSISSSDNSDNSVIDNNEELFDIHSNKFNSILINDINYTITNKLGSGTFATVWEIKNSISTYAIKIQTKGNTCIFTDETIIYNKINKSNCNKKYFVNFINSSKILINKEKKNYLLLERYGADLSVLLPQLTNNVKLCKKIIYQLLLSIKELHYLKIMHTDIKPENILTNYINKNDKITNIKLTDFGSAIYEGEYSSKVFSIQTKEYRAPEIILEYESNEKIDIWSIGCVLYEILTGKILFNSDNNINDLSSTYRLSLMIETLGDIPKKMLNTKKYNYLFSNDILNIKRILIFNPLHLKLEYLYKNNHTTINEYNLLIDLLYSMLEYDPEKRLSAKKCLEHQWFKNIY